MWMQTFRRERINVGNSPVSTKMYLNLYTNLPISLCYNSIIG